MHSHMVSSAPPSAPRASVLRSLTNTFSVVFFPSAHLLGVVSPRSVPEFDTDDPFKFNSMSQALKQRFIGAVEDEWQLFSDNAADYELGPHIGFGASSTVYHAMYKPTQTPCAIKVVDLDKLPQSALHLLRRETQLMSLSKHPNVLRVRGSWTDEHRLSIAFRLMNAGSAADVMRYAWPGGMNEEVVKCILKQALEGLHYLHINGFIHRDVKAANLLIDDDGTVLLGDLGVAADLLDDQNHPRDADSHHRRAISFEPSSHAVFARSGPVPPTATAPAVKVRKRKSFVGTPCWMAPEVINGQQYDASADIWSLGITAIELTQGRPPRSRESSKSVLVRTVTDAPPILPKTCGDGVTTLSSAFIALVAQCLAKNPASRPSAGELLQSPFFRSTKKKSYLVSTVLKDLPPLTSRQERRKLASAHPTRMSVGSWDFTAHSPTATMDGRWRNSLVGSGGSGRATPRTHGSGGRSRAHSRAVSVDALALQGEHEPAFAHDLHHNIQRLQLASTAGQAQPEEHQYLPAVISSSPEPEEEEDELDLPAEVPAPSSSASSDEPSPLVTPSSTPPSQAKAGMWGKLRGKDSKPKPATERKLSKSGGLSGLLTRTISRK